MQFELARRDQVKIGARLRKTKERDRNEETYGKRRKPKQSDVLIARRERELQERRLVCRPARAKPPWPRWQTRR